MGVQHRMLRVQEQTRDLLNSTGVREFRFQYLTDGTALADFSAGASATPGYENVETAGIRWNDHSSHTAVKSHVVLPRNFDGTRDVTVYVLASKTGATAADATTFVITAFVTSSGDLYDADADFGGTTSAMTGAATAKTMQTVSLTLTAANLPDAGPCSLNLTIVPTTAVLTTDDVIVHHVWVEYFTKAI